jgi:glycosyltransferase involved in cell wall biosynthesis
MHIGFLTPEYATDRTPAGGLATYLKKTSALLVERGHRVTIFWLSDRNAAWLDHGVHIIEVQRIPFLKKMQDLPVIGGLFLLLNQWIRSRALARRVITLHDEDPVDLLQVPSYLALGTALLHNGRFPIICRASSYTPLWRRAYGRRRILSDIVRESLERYQITGSDAAFAPSEFIAQTLSDELKRKISVIRTQVEIPVTVTWDYSLYDEHLKGKKYLLFFGSLSPIKGVDLIADVVPQVLTDHPEVYFAFIGRDDGMANGQTCYDYIRDRTRQLEDHVFYHPAVPKAKLYPVISHATGVLMPSRVDNYPNACLEAQYSGVPVIGSTNSSLDEMIVDGETGFLVLNNDRKSLVRGIERMLDQSPLKREEMIRKIRDQVQKMVKEDRMGQLEAFYEDTRETYTSASRIP